MKAVDKVAERRSSFFAGSRVAQPDKELSSSEEAFLEQAVEIGSCARDRVSSEKIARGNTLTRVRSAIFMLPAWFAPHARIRTFFHRLRGVKIGKNVEIGYFCIIGNVHPQEVTIEDEAVIAAGSVIIVHDNAYYYTRHGEIRFGPVVIRKRAFIGLKSVIMPDVTVGEAAIVGANSLVLRDVPPNTVFGGVPARKIKDLGDQTGCCRREGCCCRGERDMGGL